jgi:tetratricopeptide (TPR) repeat protein
LRRAIALIPRVHARRGALLQELGIVLEAAGNPDAAITAHESAIEEARSASDLATEVSARVELEHLRLPRTVGATADALLDATGVAVPVLEAAGDHRRVGRALLFRGWVYGGRRGQQQARLDAAERALPHYRKSTWPISTCVGEIANAMYYGPTPVPEAVARCEELLATEVTNRYGGANVGAFLGGLLAQLGDFDGARSLVASARTTYDELGHELAHGTFSGVFGDVELLADDPIAAEAVLRSFCADFANTRAYSHLASKAGDLAEALYRQGRLDEAAEWTEAAERHSAADDVDARVLWMPVAAKLAARREDFTRAAEVGREAVALAASGDALNRSAKARVDLAEVLQLSGQEKGARQELESALALYERKANAVEATRVQTLLGATTVA